MKLWGSLAGRKTYVACAITVVGAIGAYLTGDATGMQTFQTLMTALMAAGVRNGLANS